jgi:adenosylcobinamide-phosphate synthase
MKRSTLLPAAYLIDHFAGDPEWFPHPVRIIGLAITRLESVLHRPNQSRIVELASGAALTCAVIGATWWLSATLIERAHRQSRTLGDATELLLAWTCLAARNLADEASSVTHALEQDDLTLARQRLARIVGRDTAHLDAQEISRAVIETVAESASDGIVAPLFYMALGGVPLALAYKAINTLDSMIGHADHRYFYFGKIAARLDDVANLIPSRLTALAIITVCPIHRGITAMSGKYAARSAWRTWRRDGSKHKSPNAGQPESAMSGALQVVLGGSNTYAGELIASPRIGAEFPAATPAKAAQAIRIVARASLLCLIAAIIVTPVARHD